MKTKPHLDNASLEFIMASKSLSPFDNVMNVYKTLYGNYSSNTSIDALVEILSSIIQSSTKIQLNNILSDLLPSNRWKSACLTLSDNTPLNEIIVRYLIFKLYQLPKNNFIISSEKENNLPLKNIILSLLPKMQFLTEKHFFEKL